MSLDVEGHIEILNHSAKQMLQLKPGVDTGRHYRDVLEGSLYNNLRNG
ncbi:MAG: hypothetical protein Ct9H300mP28_17070 [Pseudomonadota bacterium]|nr:MAG: hypothetical protein Ct9H300mP28_17070 [Pseudomonadota bacterium]